MATLFFIIFCALFAGGSLKAFDHNTDAFRPDK